MAIASAPVGRGRIAWILSIVVGVILLVIGLVMLIASRMTRGGAD